MRSRLPQTSFIVARRQLALAVGSLLVDATLLLTVPGLAFPDRSFAWRALLEPPHTAPAYAAPMMQTGDDTQAAEPGAQASYEPTATDAPATSSQEDARRGEGSNFAQPALAVTSPPLPPHFQLPAPRHEYQTWNNCGPATLSMALRLFGRSETQAVTAHALKPDRNDKNVRPDEIVAYARATGLDAAAYVNGDLERLKRLLVMRAAVIVETWLVRPPNDDVGHYRLLLGYDDAARQFILHDSLFGPLVRLSYDTLDAGWRVFNRTYIVITRPEQRAELETVLESDTDEGSMYAAALERAQAEIAARPNDAFAWFNMGSSLAGLGRFADAAAAFERARAIGLPWRMLWYQFGPLHAYEGTGRWQDLLALTAEILRTAPNHEEALYFRGRALQGLGQVAQARQHFQAALRYNPHFAPAALALSQL